MNSSTVADTGNSTARSGSLRMPRKVWRKSPFRCPIGTQSSSKRHPTNFPLLTSQSRFRSVNSVAFSRLQSQALGRSHSTGGRNVDRAWVFVWESGVLTRRECNPSDQRPRNVIRVACPILGRDKCGRKWAERLNSNKVNVG